MKQDTLFASAEELSAENQELRAQLSEANEALEAIRTGTVDALVVSGPAGNRIFSLSGAETPYRALVEEINEGALLLRRDGTILYANPRFAQLARTASEQIAASQWRRFFLPCDHGRLEKLLKVAFLNSGIREEFCLLTGSGAVVPVELSLSLLKGTQGVTFSCIIADLTERKSAEDALRQVNETLEARVHERTAELSAANDSLHREMAERERLEAAKARLAAIVEHSLDAIISAELDGTITSWNSAAEQLFGYCAEEAIGKSIALIVPPELRRREDSILDQLRRGKAVVQYDSIRLTKEGRHIPVSLTISPIRDKTGAIIGAAKIIRDISERKHAEEMLTRSKEQLEQLVQERTAKLQDTVAELEHFSYTITHDMRAPLRVMRGLGTLLMKNAATCLKSKGCLDYLTRIVDSAARMDKLITDALQYSGVLRQHLELAPVDADALLRGMLQSYPEFQSPLAEIRVEGRLPIVLGNEAALTQVFSNFLSNAVKFVRPGQKPEVHIWAEPVAGFSRFWFEDQGIGIEKEYQDKIWQMFHQLNKGIEGTGIGLALVRKAAERMGGKVGVDSEPGHGSRFWIELKEGRNPDLLS